MEAESEAAMATWARFKYADQRGGINGFCHECLAQPIVSVVHRRERALLPEGAGQAATLTRLPWPPCTICACNAADANLAVEMPSLLKDIEPRRGKYTKRYIERRRGSSTAVTLCIAGSRNDEIS